MRNRFFVDATLESGSIVRLDDAERHHARVLRVREGEEVEVFDGRGHAYSAAFDSADSIRLTSAIASREPEAAIHLAMALIQIDKFELVLQKATELGVTSIIPLITERCEVRPERYRGKSERWEKILFEATKQSGRARIPELETSAAFAEVIGRPGAKTFFDADAPSTTREPDNPTTLFIGPEGGWSEEELRLARENGAAFRQLGPRRLRAETAAIAAMTLVVLRHHDG